jgi:hypothetical protein
MAGITTTPFAVSQMMREQFARLREGCAAWFQPAPEPGPALVWEHTPWQEYWGAPYGLDLKRWLLKPVFERLEAEGKVGDLIVDIGSGAQPVTQFLAKRAGRKRICVDVAGDNCSAGIDGIQEGSAESLSSP